MSRLEWGLGPRPYEMGVDRGVLYLDGVGVAWNGLASVDEEAAASVESTYYFDGLLRHVAVDNSDYKAKVQAYTYPDAFAEYNGYSERDIYQRFGFSYRTQYGDGYQLHLVYNALVDPNARTWGTISDTIDPSLFGWDISASSIPVLGARPTAHLIIDSASMHGVVSAIENALYGTATTEPRLPEAAELIAIYEDAMRLKVTYNGDGTYTVDGPDELVTVNSYGQFWVNADTVLQLKGGKFQVSSYSDD